MLFAVLTATGSRNSAHAAWERNGKSLRETSLQMSSSLTEKMYNSRKSLLMFSSPWCQAGLSVQLAAILSCPLPAFHWHFIVLGSSTAAQHSIPGTQHTAGLPGTCAQHRLLSVLKLFRDHFQSPETIYAFAASRNHLHCGSEAQAACTGHTWSAQSPVLAPNGAEVRQHLPPRCPFGLCHSV